MFSRPAALPDLAPLVRSALFACAMAAVSVSAGCADDPPGRHEGGPGYACYFDSDCSGALVCAETTAAEFPVCTGYGLEGDSCSDAAPCAWIRDDRGLPLSCGDEGVCAFPPDDLDA